MQTRFHSFIESLTNIAVGFLVGITSQILIFPLFDIHVSLVDNALICMWFTVIGITRSYVIRRWFTKRTERIPINNLLKWKENE